MKEEMGLVSCSKLAPPYFLSNGSRIAVKGDEYFCYSCGTQVSYRKSNPPQVVFNCECYFTRIGKQP